MPLERLQCPRIDVLMQLSPVFRDAFGLLMGQLDRLVKEAAKAEEPPEMNFVKNHIEEALASGMSFESATAWNLCFKKTSEIHKLLCSIRW